MNTDQILAQLGPCVLLAIPLEKKGPNTKEWQKLTLTRITPEYVASLNGSKTSASLEIARADLSKESPHLTNYECVASYSSDD